MNYILISPARNEETYIRKTLDSMVAQTQPPLRWVIVDDGSSDRTAEIVREYTARHPWIQLAQRPPEVDRSFAGKVRAFNAGFEHVKDLPCDVIGNLDADLSFPPDYLAFLMARFAENPRLGVAGTPFTQDGGYDSAKDSFEGENYVAGGCQLFRVECFREIGGYVPVRGGGIDWIAVTTARMKGWLVRSFPERRFHHYRTLGTAQMNPLQAIFDYGRRAYTLGSSPIWHAFRALYRMTRRPYLLGGVSLFLGYAWAAVRRVKRNVPPEMIRFYRREQMARLRAILAAVITFRKVDGFRVAATPPPAAEVAPAAKHLAGA